MQTETLELSVQETLPLFKTNKSQRQGFVLQIMEQIEEGNLEPLKVHLQIKAMENIVSLLTDRNEKTNKDFCQVAKKYNSLLLESAQKYGSKSFDFEMGKYEIKETGSKYDYSKCNDSVMAGLHRQAEEISEKVKEREKFLQTVPAKGLLVTDEETGETETIYPPSKSSTTSLSLKLK